MTYKRSFLIAATATLLLGAAGTSFAELDTHADQEPPINIEAGGTHLEDGLSGTPETDLTTMSERHDHHYDNNRSDVSLDSMSNKNDPLPNDGDQRQNPAF